MLADCLSEIGYKESVYQKDIIFPREEFPFAYLRKFYDEHGTVRKEYTEDSCDKVHFIKVFDEKGNIWMYLRTHISMRRPYDYIIVDAYSSIRHMHHRCYSVSLGDWTISKVEEE